MTNKSFMSTLLIMLLLFISVISGTGCGGGSSSNPISDPNNFNSSPDIEPSPEPEAGTTFTVTFDSNGGSEVSSINVKSGDTIEMPEAPTKEGWIFAGWYKDGEFTQVFIFGTNGDKITGNMTLYAQWLVSETLIAEYAASEIVIGYAKSLFSIFLA